jgi:seryl-tRNA synthetase
LKDAEEILQLLELPYRVATLATGDVSFAAAKCYDIEAYAPGIDRWLEVSSCSNYEDFQARRMNIRFRRNRGSKPEFIHTMNGSGVALPRTMIAIIENYQTDEGTLIVPEVLRSYMNLDIIK